MRREEAIKYIRFCMCEGRLVGNTKPIIDEKWQAGTMAIKALSAIDDIKEEINAYLQAEGFGSEYRNDVVQIIDKHIGKEGAV